MPRSLGAMPRTRLRRLRELPVDDRTALSVFGSPLPYRSAVLFGRFGALGGGEAPDPAPGIPVPPSVRRLARRRALSAPGG